MEESLDAYRKKLSAYSNEDLQGICNSIDREKHKARYQAVLDELDIRKAGDTGEAASGTPDGNRYRTAWKRVGAGLVDALIFLVAFMFFMKPFQAIESGKIDLLSMHLFGTSFFAYSILMHWKFGATVGKLLLGVRVIDNGSESKISLKQAVMRDIVPLGLAVLTLMELGIFKRESSFLLSLSDNVNSWWGIAEILTALSNKKRRSIHDFIAGTVCIRVKDRN